MPLLEVDNLTAGYGGVEVVHGVSLELAENSVTSIIGPNGAGKTTLLRAIMGLPSYMSGSVLFEGDRIETAQSSDRTRRGMSLVPEGGAVFPDLTVEENLRLGEAVATGSGRTSDHDFVRRSFPRLADRYKQAAGTLSGGERQMLALARALLMAPKVLILDEPSIGLAPRIVEEVFRFIAQLRDSGDIGLSVLLVEQNVVEALEVSDDVYVMEQGQFVVHGSADDISSDSRLRSAYLGT